MWTEQHRSIDLIYTEPGPVSRRHFLAHNALGIGGVALAWLLQQEQLLATPSTVAPTRPTFDLKPKEPHAAPRAQAVISMFMNGGPSHMDLFDPKPELSRQSGKDYHGDVVFSFINRASRKLLGSPWKFSKHGECGTELSELLPHLGEVVDDICLIRSMQSGSNDHVTSIRYFNSGIPAVAGRPSLGAWVTYALGSESQDLPAYMVLTDPGGLPIDGTQNWSNGWMPSLFQGTVLRPQEPRILNLDAPAHLKGQLQRKNLDLLGKLNQRHLARHPGQPDLEARIASYELAARMQTAAREALDISGETKATRQLYGLDDPVTSEYGERCLIARRLVERGVRFVQLFLNSQPWDHHTSIAKSLPPVCQRTDKPAAALVKDLKMRGLLDTTLVHWGGEFGRLPVSENHGNPETLGRDHNGEGFSMWLAGGGVRGGMTFGATDEFGHRAVEGKMNANDCQATLLHLLGIDHSKLVYLHNGQEQQLTNGRPARVVTDILA